MGKVRDAIKAKISEMRIAIGAKIMGGMVIDVIEPDESPEELSVKDSTEKMARAFLMPISGDRDAMIFEQATWFYFELSSETFEIPIPAGTRLYISASKIDGTRDQPGFFGCEPFEN